MRRVTEIGKYRQEERSKLEKREKVQGGDEGQTTHRENTEGRGEKKEYRRYTITIIRKM